MGKVQPSRRAIAARQNGRLGGLKTAQTQSQEFLEERASKAGLSTRTRYGTDYYRYLRSLNPNKPRTKTTAQKIQEVVKEIIPNVTGLPSPKELMKAAAEKLDS